MFLKIIFYTAIFIVIVGLGILVWQQFAYRVSEPKYTVLKSEGPIQIRQYPEIIVAQVQMPGERYPAINAGFRVLADYIFGNNQPNQKISMTAPVLQEGVNIAMTAPVTQQMVANNWLVRFVMPSEFTLATLPKPNNPKIELIQVPSTTFCVIQFSGSSSDKNLQEHLGILLDFIAKNKLTSVGTPIMAFYNPPWILPYFRRNEIMIEIAK